ncbi:MAG: UDP-glucuronic acid decarboxylase family protein [Candidatus Bathyarchaeota archaeon]
MLESVIVKDVERIATKLSSNFVNKSVLVTGGAGFLGSWLCDILVASKAKVTCIDNLSTGLTENIEHHKGEQNFQFINVDVSKFETGGKQDFILHLASRASPEEYQQHPIETLTANSLGSLKMLETARKHDATILYTSTSEVYGDAQIIPTPETYWGHVNPVGVRSCYDEGKRFSEALFTAYHRQYGLDTRIVRIFNTYGPRIRADGAYARALPKFISQALKNQPITVYGDGAQTRSFCYVTDTIQGILTTLINTKTKGEIFNIGNPHEITILELANKIKRTINSKSKITFHPLPLDDPKRRCPDITKISTTLGWKPETDFEDGLKKTIEWYSQR